jgi:hypothetical protein
MMAHEPARRLIELDGSTAPRMLAAHKHQFVVE